MRTLANTANDAPVAPHSLIDFLRQQGLQDAAALAAVEQLLAAQDAGHSCLDLQELRHETIACEAQAWQQHLLTLAPFFGEAGSASIFILDHQALYLQRAYAREQRSAVLLAQRCATPAHDRPSIEELRCALRNLQYLHCDTQQPNWKRYAAALATQNRLSLIVGGPGTGKTTTVRAIVALFERLHPSRKLIIRYAAPTGKAARRLDAQALTLHRLLDIHPLNNTPKYNEKQHLPCDIVIVDEASMLDGNLFDLLLRALPPHAKLILLGDPDQLFAIGSGSILADLSGDARPTRQQMQFIYQLDPELRQLRNVPTGESDHALQRHCIRLTESHRFGAGSGIGELARAILQHRSPCELKNIMQQHEELTWYEHFASLPAALHTFYDDYLKVCRQASQPQDYLHAFAQQQILCAENHGERGNAQLNALLDRFFAESLGDPLYPGRPIIYLRNNPELELSNGDIGVFCRDAQGRKKICFPAAQGDELRLLEPFFFSESEYDLAFAISVHKSQGSEYDNVLCFLPESKDSPLLSRELLYTALTRARKRFAWLASEAVIAACLRQHKHRNSHLSERVHAELTALTQQG